MTHDRRVAAAQTMPIGGDVAANVDEHVRLAHLAADARAQLVVFPELSLTGYELELASELAFSQSDARLSPLVEVASARGTTLVVGAPVRIGPRLHIGAFILAADGTVALYTKRHLGAFSDSARCDGIVPPAEATFFHPGDLDPLVRFGGHTAAVAVCADVGRPSHSQRAADRGADTYLASMFVIPSELEGDLARLEGYAARHSMAVVFANYGGPSGGLASGGRSGVWSDSGKLVVQLESGGSGVAVAGESDAGWRATKLALGGARRGA